MASGSVAGAQQAAAAGMLQPNSMAAQAPLSFRAMLEHDIHLGQYNRMHASALLAVLQPADPNNSAAAAAAAAPGAGAAGALATGEVPCPMDASGHSMDTHAGAIGPHGPAQLHGEALVPTWPLLVPPDVAARLAADELRVQQLAWENVRLTSELQALQQQHSQLLLQQQMRPQHAGALGAPSQPRLHGAAQASSASIDDIQGAIKLVEQLLRAATNLQHRQRQRRQAQQQQQQLQQLPQGSVEGPEGSSAGAPPEGSPGFDDGVSAVVQLACELDKVIKQITGVSFAEGHDPSAVDGAEGSAAQAQHGPGQGVPGQQGQGQQGQDQGEQGVAQGTRKKKKKKKKNKQAGVQGQQGVGPAGGPGGAATAPAAPAPRHTPIVFPAALSRPIATAAAGAAHPPVLPMSQHPEKFSAPLKQLPSMAVPLMASIAASAAPSSAPAPVATAATLAMGEAVGAAAPAPGAAAAAMGPSTAKPLAAAVAAMNERQRLELLASAAQTWVVVLDYSASSSGYVGGKVGRATTEFPTRGQGACTSRELVLLMAEGVLQEQTLMTGVATPKSCVPLPLAASFLRPMKLLLAQLAAGVGYDPLAEHQVRQPAPPPAWSVPLVLFGPLVRQYAGPSSVAAATALAERREKDIEAQLGHRSVRALLQLLTSCDNWTVVYKYTRSGAWGTGGGQVGCEEVVRQLADREIDAMTPVVGTERPAKRGQWVPTSLVLPLGALVHLQAGLARQNYQPVNPGGMASLTRDPALIFGAST